MNYTVKIVDTKKEAPYTSDEGALASSIILEWHGGDIKDALVIVGSSLSFTLAGWSIEDGHYLDLFTGDETHYKVILEDETGAVIWTGFLLPDAYSEPYSSTPILVDFEAVDGLGRLKGKYLPGDFYREEKSVIQILAKCLELTGLDLHFRFAPALENAQQKDYDKIYLDTSLFVDNGKKQDAHTILSDLLESMLSCVFQADNFFNIEGLNIREQRVYTAKEYDVQGSFVKEHTITRLRKQVKSLQPTAITVQPPYGIIEVTHEREPMSLPEGLSSVKNDKWVGRETDSVYALDWVGENGSPMANSANGTVSFNPHTTDFKMSFRERPYLVKGRKYEFRARFKIHSENDKAAMVAEGKWNNPFVIVLEQHDQAGPYEYRVLATNIGAELIGAKDIPQVFGEDMTCETNVQLVATYSGPFDTTISYHVDQGGGITKVDIEEFSLVEIDFQEKYISEFTNEAEYTLKKEHELVYADDSTGLSKAFRLHKMSTKGQMTRINFTVHRQFERNGFWYSVVSLKDAYLVKHNEGEVYRLNAKVDVLEVIYNYNNSQEHVIKTAQRIAASDRPQIEVRVYDANSLTEDRSYWERWSDSFYKVDYKRYPDAATGVLRMLSNTPIIKMDMSVLNNVKFNDFIHFHFMGAKDFMLTNCRWDLDNGISEVTAIESYYGADSDGNIPPVVSTGEDVFLNNETTKVLSCVANDPDGFITDYLWEEITTGAVIANPTSDTTEVSNLTKGLHTFRITVTDINGATASDEINIYRVQQTNLSVTDTFVEDEASGWVESESKLVFDPPIDSFNAINVRGIILRENLEGSTGGDIKVLQNGILMREVGLNNDSDDFSLNVVQGDEVVIHMRIFWQSSVPTNRVRFKIDSADFTEGYGTVTGVPISRELNTDELPY